MSTALSLAEPSTRPSRLSPDDSPESVLAKAVLVTPTPRQLAWQRDEISAFIHFGPNTFSDREWGDGKEDPKLFNPTALDTRQWVRAAKAAGISRLILTAKHHDGFCLWPSKFTEHSVKNSPWRDGKGDVVREFVEACRAENLRFGLYLSPWDRHEPSYGDSPKYNQYFLNQLRELLTAYPDTQEVWFDGACAEGPNGKRQEYDWRAYWKLIRELTPNATISVRGPDVRWCGNEAGHTRTSEWSVIPLPGDDLPWPSSDLSLSGYLRDIYGDDLGSRSVLLRSRLDRPVLAWYPSQVNTSIRPGWFYHATEDSRVRSLQDLLNVYFGSVGGNGQFLLNIPPDRRGLFHENDVARLHQLGQFLRSTFSTNLLSPAKLTAEVTGGTSLSDPLALLNPQPDTVWTTSDNPTAVTLTALLPAPVRANCLLLQEHLPSSQRVESFELDILEGTQWRTVATYTTIGYKRLARFPDANLSGVRIRFTGYRIRPTLTSLGLYLAPAVVSAPVFSRDPSGTVSISVPPGTLVRYTLDASDPTPTSPVYTSPIPLPLGGTLTAETIPLTPGSDTIITASALTRAHYGIAKAKWKILSTSSQNSPNESAANAIDDNPQTLWHTKYTNGTDPMPHHLAIDLGEPVLITAFTYTPRQDTWDGGIILTARFETSPDGTTWTPATPHAPDTTFDNIVNSRQPHTLHLLSPITARYIRLTALRTAKDSNLASAAEISVHVK